MAVNLNKGQKISLSKAAQDSGVGGGFVKGFIGLGWDVKRFDGGSDFDLDASCFLCGANGKIRKTSDFVFYGSERRTADDKPCDDAGCVIHSGDNRTGSGDGDDEVIMIDTSKIPEDVQKLVFSITIYDAQKRGQTFGQVENSYVRVVEGESGTEVARFDLGEDFSCETAIVAAEIYRHNGEWKLNAIGSGFEGGLEALCKSYGVDVE